MLKPNSFLIVSAIHSMAVFSLGGIPYDERKKARREVTAVHAMQGKKDPLRRCVLAASIGELFFRSNQYFKCAPTTTSGRRKCEKFRNIV